jgi:hypothetical protein
MMVARSTEGELQLPASHGKHIGERNSISLKHEQHLVKQATEWTMKQSTGKANDRPL